MSSRFRGRFREAILGVPDATLPERYPVAVRNLPEFKAFSSVIHLPYNASKTSGAGQSPRKALFHPLILARTRVSFKQTSLGSDGRKKVSSPLL